MHLFLRGNLRRHNRTRHAVDMTLFSSTALPDRVQVGVTLLLESRKYQEL